MARKYRKHKNTEPLPTNYGIRWKKNKIKLVERASETKIVGARDLLVAPFHPGGLPKVSLLLATVLV
jgi:hypothetical protein